ncbi:hypothetical protein HU200_033205 [Digitaria exilis]|uniref:Uncharacterized protein n=1 Tax=Digitaria exilis TaxID=1010633 RepID=A0A835BIE7_9POAL|nr:hypothetical protein HU200_033205 [Digitaria exilis]
MHAWPLLLPRPAVMFVSPHVHAPIHLAVDGHLATLCTYVCCSAEIYCAGGQSLANHAHPPARGRPRPVVHDGVARRCGRALHKKADYGLSVLALRMQLRRGPPLFSHRRLAVLPDAAGSRGGLLTAWNANTLSLDYFITCRHIYAHTTIPRLASDAAANLAGRLLPKNDTYVRAAAKVWAPPALISNCKFIILLFDNLCREPVRARAALHFGAKLKGDGGGCKHRLSFFHAQRSARTQHNIYVSAAAPTTFVASRLVAGSMVTDRGRCVARARARAGLFLCRLWVESSNSSPLQGPPYVLVNVRLPRALDLVPYLFLLVPDVLQALQREGGCAVPRQYAVLVYRPRGT